MLTRSYRISYYTAACWITYVGTRALAHRRARHVALVGMLHLGHLPVHSVLLGGLHRQAARLAIPAVVDSDYSDRIRHGNTIHCDIIC
jgi:hypothetical protein